VHVACIPQKKTDLIPTLSDLIDMNIAAPCPRNESVRLATFSHRQRTSQRRCFAMARGELIEERVTQSIIGTFYDVYNALGFGLLENLYTVALQRELRRRGHSAAREVWVPVWYKGELLGRQRLDLVVDDRVVVEVKSTMDLHPAAIRQCHSYLKASNLEVGLVLHFGPKPCVKRVLWRTSDDVPRTQRVT
jgi:GxxExxY protein